MPCRESSDCWIRFLSIMRDVTISDIERLRADTDAADTVFEMDEEAFRARFRGSAMSRAKRAGLARNAALLLGNRGERAAVPALRRALSDPDEGVRRAAAWALSRCEG